MTKKRRLLGIGVLSACACFCAADEENGAIAMLDGFQTGTYVDAALDYKGEAAGDVDTFSVNGLIPKQLYRVQIVICDEDVAGTGVPIDVALARLNGLGNKIGSLATSAGSLRDINDDGYKGATKVYRATSSGELWFAVTVAGDEDLDGLADGTTNVEIGRYAVSVQLVQDTADPDDIVDPDYERGELRCAADLSGDGVVDNGDLAIWIAIPVGDARRDWNADGVYDSTDDSQFASWFITSAGSCSSSINPDTDLDFIPNVDEVGLGTDPNSADTDGDYIMDGDEYFGSIGGLALPTMGANPKRSTLFLQVNWEPGLDPDDGFSSSTLQDPVYNSIFDAISDRFAVSPEANPDLSTGIDLIFDTGLAYPLFAGGEAQPILNGGYPKAVTLFESAEIAVAAQITGLDTANIMTANELKAELFPDRRKGYVRFAYRGKEVYVCPPDDTAGSPVAISTGVAMLPGDTFVFMLNAPSTTKHMFWRARAMMHEFGHTLGLFHGGCDTIGFKPNYSSIMNKRYARYGVDRNRDAVPDGLTLLLSENNNGSPNYFTEYNALPAVSGESGLKSGEILWDLLDYSRETLKFLDEDKLDEAVPMAYWDELTLQWVTPVNGPTIDWDHNGVPTSGLLQRDTLNQSNKPLYYREIDPDKIFNNAAGYNVWYGPAIDFFTDSKGRVRKWTTFPFAAGVSGNLLYGHNDWKNLDYSGIVQSALQTDCWQIDTTTNCFEQPLP